MSDENHQIVFQRSPHDKENPYAQISRALIRDETISPECRWMIIYFLSMRDDFKINIKQIWAHVKKFMGRNKVYCIIEEACEAGYMKREDKIVNNLKRGVIYYISESPAEEFKKCFRRSSFRDTGIRHTENGEALSSSSKEELIKEKEKEEDPSPPIFSFEKVKMLQSEYDNLVQKHGKEKIEAYVLSLSDYSKMKPRKFKEYGCHYTTICRWIQRDEKEKATHSKHPTTNAIEENKKICELIAQKFANRVKSRDIGVGENYIEFIYGPNSPTDYIEFKEYGFKDRVKTALRKMGLFMEGL